MFDTSKCIYQCKDKNVYNFPKVIYGTLSVNICFPFCQPDDDMFDSDFQLKTFTVISGFTVSRLNKFEIKFCLFISFSKEIEQIWRHMPLQNAGSDV